MRTYLKNQLLLGLLVALLWPLFNLAALAQTADEKRFNSAISVATNPTSPPQQAVRAVGIIEILMANKTALADAYLALGVTHTIHLYQQASDEAQRQLSYRIQEAYINNEYTLQMGRGSNLDACSRAVTLIFFLGRPEGQAIPENVVAQRMIFLREGLLRDLATSTDDPHRVVPLVGAMLKKILLESDDGTEELTADAKLAGRALIELASRGVFAQVSNDPKAPATMRNMCIGYEADALHMSEDLAMTKEKATIQDHLLPLLFSDHLASMLRDTNLAPRITAFRLLRLGAEGRLSKAQGVIDFSLNLIRGNADYLRSASAATQRTDLRVEAKRCLAVLAELEGKGLTPEAEAEKHPWSREEIVDILDRIENRVLPVNERLTALVQMRHLPIVVIREHAALIEGRAQGWVEFLFEAEPAPGELSPVTFAEPLAARAQAQRKMSFRAEVMQTMHEIATLGYGQPLAAALSRNAMAGMLPQLSVNDQFFMIIILRESLGMKGGKFRESTIANVVALLEAARASAIFDAVSDLENLQSLLEVIRQGCEAIDRNAANYQAANELRLAFYAQLQNRDLLAKLLASPVKGARGEALVTANHLGAQNNASGAAVRQMLAQQLRDNALLTQPLATEIEAQGKWIASESLTLHQATVESALLVLRDPQIADAIKMPLIEMVAQAFTAHGFARLINLSPIEFFEGCFYLARLVDAKLATRAGSSFHPTFLSWLETTLAAELESFRKYYSASRTISESSVARSLNLLLDIYYQADATAIIRARVINFFLAMEAEHNTLSKMAKKTTAPRIATDCIHALGILQTSQIYRERETGRTGLQSILTQRQLEVKTAKRVAQTIAGVIQTQGTGANIKGAIDSLGLDPAIGPPDFTGESGIGIVGSDRPRGDGETPPTPSPEEMFTFLITMVRAGLASGNTQILTKAEQVLLYFQKDQAVLTWLRSEGFSTNPTANEGLRVWVLALTDPRFSFARPASLELFSLWLERDFIKPYELMLTLPSPRNAKQVVLEEMIYNRELALAGAGLRVCLEAAQLHRSEFVRLKATRILADTVRNGFLFSIFNSPQEGERIAAREVATALLLNPALATEIDREAFKHGLLEKVRAIADFSHTREGLERILSGNYQNVIAADLRLLIEAAKFFPEELAIRQALAALHRHGAMEFLLEHGTKAELRLYSAEYLLAVSQDPAHPDQQRAQTFLRARIMDGTIAEMSRGEGVRLDVEVRRPMAKVRGTDISAPATVTSVLAEFKIIAATILHYYSSDADAATAQAAKEQLGYCPGELRRAVSETIAAEYARTPKTEAAGNVATEPAASKSPAKSGPLTSIAAWYQKTVGAWYQKNVKPFLRDTFGSDSKRGALFYPTDSAASYNDGETGGRQVATAAPLLLLEVPGELLTPEVVSFMAETQALAKFVPAHNQDRFRTWLIGEAMEYQRNLAIGKTFAFNTFKFHVAMMVRDVLLGHGDAVDGLGHLVNPLSHLDYATFGVVAEGGKRVIERLYKTRLLQPMGQTKWIMQHGVNMAFAMWVMGLARDLLANPDDVAGAWDRHFNTLQLRNHSVSAVDFILARKISSPAIKSIVRMGKYLNRARKVKQVQQALAAGAAATTGVGTAAAAVMLTEGVIEELAVLTLQGIFDSYLIPILDEYALKHELVENHRKLAFSVYQSDAEKITAEIWQIHEGFRASRDWISRDYLANLGEFTQRRQREVVSWETTARERINRQWSKVLAEESPVKLPDSMLNTPNLMSFTPFATLPSDDKPGPVEQELNSFAKLSEAISKAVADELDLEDFEISLFGWDDAKGDNDVFTSTADHLEESQAWTQAKTYLQLSEHELACLTSMPFLHESWLREAIAWILLNRGTYYAQYPVQSLQSSVRRKHKLAFSCELVVLDGDSKLDMDYPYPWNSMLQAYIEMGRSFDRYQKVLYHSDRIFNDEQQPLIQRIFGNRHDPDISEKLKYVENFFSRNQHNQGLEELMAIPTTLGESYAYELAYFDRLGELMKYAYKGDQRAFMPRLDLAIAKIKADIIDERHVQGKNMMSKPATPESQPEMTLQVVSLPKV